MRVRPLLLPLLVLATACTEAPALLGPAEPPTELADLQIPPGFDFRTDRDVPVRLSAPAGHAARATGRFRLRLPDSFDADLLVDGTLMENGGYESVVRIPAGAGSLVLEYEEGDRTVATVLPVEAEGVGWHGTDAYPTGHARARPGRLPTLEATLPLPTRPDGARNPLLGRVPIDLSNYPIASVTYFPSRNSWGTIAFEDNWPSTGDYDFNDLVLSYHVVMYRNPGGSVVAMEFFLRPEAVGAEFRNAFGFSLPVDRRRVHFAEGGLSRHADEVGLAPGQRNAVVIAFDDVGMLLPGRGLRNTLPGRSMVSGAEQRIVLHFQTPLKDRDLGTPPFNPFLIVDGDRSREVHLIGMSATDRAAGWMGTGDDRGGYRTATGLPWAILLPTTWAWPAEREPVNLGHLEFADWAESGGSALTDWYVDKGRNRNRSRLFLR